MRQPWLNPLGTPPQRGVPDDFSPASAALPIRGAAIVLAVAYLLLIAGRSEAILDAAYGLPVVTGTETLIAIAEWWNDAMSSLAVPEAFSAIREWLSLGR
ncbi:MAG: hypothetical protein JWR10_609 [Rubritepida sp.]|nr:hypothetical protein [Rubritepida sp.]